MPGLEGKIGIRGVTASVDASFIDILDTVKDADSFIGWLGGFEARHGPWGGFLYGMWTKLSADAISTGPITLQVETELALAEFGGLYRLGEWSLGLSTSNSIAEGEPRLAIDLYAGGHLAYVQAEIGVNRPSPESSAVDGALSQNVTARSREDFSRWQVRVDPIIGSRATVDLYKHFQLLMGGTSAASVSARISPPRSRACSDIAFRCSDAGRSPRPGIERSGRTMKPGPMGRSSAGM